MIWMSFIFRATFSPPLVLGFAFKLFAASRGDISTPLPIAMLIYIVEFVKNGSNCP